MTLSTFDSDAEMTGSLRASMRLNQRIGLTHVQSGSTHTKRRISIATRDTTKSFGSAQYPDGTNHGLNNHGW